MTAEMLLKWWNLIYVLPFALALFYLAIYAVTGLEFGDADADADADVDADHDVDHEVDGHDHDAHESHATNPAIAFLTLLGLGRVPVSLLLMVLFMAWGVIGISINLALAGMMQRELQEWFLPLISVPLTFAASVTLTASITRSVSRWMPTVETYAHKKKELVGRSGEAICEVNGEFGLVTVRDQEGDLFQVPCRLEPDVPTVSKGQRVVLFDYDDEKGVFHVAPLEAERN